MFTIFHTIGQKGLMFFVFFYINSRKKLYDIHDQADSTEPTGVHRVAQRQYRLSRIQGLGYPRCQWLTNPHLKKKCPCKLGYGLWRSNTGCYTIWFSFLRDQKILTAESTINQHFFSLTESHHLFLELEFIMILRIDAFFKSFQTITSSGIHFLKSSLIYFSYCIV